ncbi:helix-turn-helix domain-containing protein [Aureimonas altamirensis]|nr:helix-turn-helix domain-containing protein [Aureimonas altamirensis]
MERPTLSAALLTPQDAAQYLAISTRQLRDLSRAGCLRYVNIGLRDRETRRYAPEDLDAFIQERKCQSSNRPTRLSTSMTSSFADGDIAAQLAVRLSERRKQSMRLSGAKSGSRH